MAEVASSPYSCLCLPFTNPESKECVIIPLGNGIAYESRNGYSLTCPNPKEGDSIKSYRAQCILKGFEYDKALFSYYSQETEAHHAMSLRYVFHVVPPLFSVVEIAEKEVKPEDAPIPLKINWLQIMNAIRKSADGTASVLLRTPSGERIARVGCLPATGTFPSIYGASGNYLELYEYNGNVDFSWIKLYLRESFDTPVEWTRTWKTLDDEILFVDSDLKV